MFLWPPLTGTQLSPVATRSRVTPSGHTPGNHHDRRAKPVEGHRCCVCLNTRNSTACLLAEEGTRKGALNKNLVSRFLQPARLADRKICGRKTQTINNTPCAHTPQHTLQAARVEARWCQLRNVIQSTALEGLGRARHQNQDWFDGNDADISNLLAENNGLHKAYMDLRTDATKAAFLRFRRLLQQRLRAIQDAWIIRKAEGIQGSGLNCSSAISDAAIDQLPHVATNNDLDLPPSLPETIQAVQQTSGGKAAISDAILLEIYKHGGPRLMAELTTLFQEM
ncbi:unnamed protein product [Schistocephalus solidus]|uniref:Uncharacterized protein n=1 Tax=Schistocephalus solidus TaxID=70667 RepID=A0A183TU35_SCHSO|nr:unnamed protein product [Schistocephalus solidus]